jgi:hypothetical protein
MKLNFVYEKLWFGRLKGFFQKRIRALIVGRRELNFDIGIHAGVFSLDSYFSILFKYFV